MTGRRKRGGAHWRKRQSSDKYFRRAKAEGYRARSAYKLKQIQDRFHILRQGQTVLDLGAAPGSWSQVASEILGPNGKIVAVDLQPVEPIPGVITLQGDITSPEVQARILDIANGAVDVVLSDAAPNTSGIRDRDHYLSLELIRAALQVAQVALKPGGHFVAKVFEGRDLPQLIADLRTQFAQVKPHSPDASRQESRELFLVCTAFKG